MYIEKLLVVSSNIEAIGFKENPETSPPSGTLRVWFKNGGVYDYAKVEFWHFDSLKTEKSVGSYFSANIKGKYEYKKV